MSCIIMFLRSEEDVVSLMESKLQGTDYTIDVCKNAGPQVDCCTVSQKSPWDGLMHLLHHRNLDKI